MVVCGKWVLFVSDFGHLFRVVRLPKYTHFNYDFVVKSVINQG